MTSVDGARRRTMRRSSRVLAVLLLAAAPGVLAQYGPVPGAPEERRFDLSAFAGYQLNGDASTNGGRLDIGDAPAFGAAFDWRLHTFGALELMWQYTKPSAKFTSFNPLYPSTNAFDVATHYFQIGGMTIRPMGTLEPFLGLTVGAALFLPETISQSTGGTTSAGSTWRFAATLMAGTKVWATQNVGVRLEVRMLVPVLFTSGGYYSGSAGSGLVATGGVPSLQFSFMGGLLFGK